MAYDLNTSARTLQYRLHVLGQHDVRAFPQAIQTIFRIGENSFNGSFYEIVDDGGILLRSCLSETDILVVRTLYIH